MSANTPLLGQLGDYDLLEEIAAGGMGVVYRARQRKLDRIVALKVVLAGAMASEDELKRFRLEAAAAARLDHPNIVSVFEIGEEQGRLYFTMPFVPGPPLSAKIAAGVLGNREAAELVRQIALGVDFAHRHGVVHRDLKPSNILIDLDGRPRITDFGLAKHLELEHSLTGTGQVLGTPGYMAPEQAAGANDQIGPRTDVYGLGAILFALLTGRPPFEGSSSHEVLLKVAEEPPMSPRKLSPSVSRDMEAICLRCLSKDPQQRYATAMELADELDRVTRGKPDNLRATGNMDRLTRELKQPRMLAITISVIFLVSIISVSVARRKTETPPVAKTSLTISETRPDGSLSNRMLTTEPDVSISGLKHSVDNAQIREVTPDGGQTTGTSWYGWPVDAPRPAIAPLTAEQAQRHQHQWAEYLNVPVEYTNSIDMKFRLIPPGEFLMGETSDGLQEMRRHAAKNNPFYTESLDGMSPQHRVILTVPFYLGVHEVTQKNFREVLGNNPSAYGGENSAKARALVPSNGTDDYPVELVSWRRAVEFCVRLSEEEGLTARYSMHDPGGKLLEGNGYRMPTEAEWVWACCLGDDKQADAQTGSLETWRRNGWYRENADRHPHPVGLLGANAYGLFDVFGNVYEYCQDRWDPTYFQQFADVPAINPPGSLEEYVGSLKGIRRTIRGGGWLDPATYRNPLRFHSGGDIHVGLRITLTVDAVRPALQVKRPEE